MAIEFEYDDRWVTLKVAGKKGGFLKQFLQRTDHEGLQEYLNKNPAIAFAVADLRTLADEFPEALVLEDQCIRVTHDLAARLNANAAESLGFPAPVHLTLMTDVEGSLGSADFRLRYKWTKSGQQQLPKRVGCILKTADGDRRLPKWMLDAICVADDHQPGQGEAVDWEALARFRKALDPTADNVIDALQGRVAMTEFLKGLQVRLVDQLSISPNRENSDFEVVPFSSQTLGREGRSGEVVSEASSELTGENLRTFQWRVRERGALSAYRLGRGEYVVIDQTATPAMRIMAQMQRAPVEERRAFIQNPRQRITAAIEEHLRSAGKLENLTPAEQAELIDAKAQPVFLETREFSERVTGITLYRPPTIAAQDGQTTTWLPETYGADLKRSLEMLPTSSKVELAEMVHQAIESGTSHVEYKGFSVPADTAVLDYLKSAAEGSAEETTDLKPPSQADTDNAAGAPVVLDTKVNFEELLWRSKSQARVCRSADEEVPNLLTSLKDHQGKCLSWQIGAWKSGLPGILNADEQGLGKTLETIAFLSWLKKEMDHADSHISGPVLVVAPTSLLENWEQEVKRHLKEPGLGHLIRLFGAGLSTKRATGAKGTDIQSGEVKLDFGALQEAIQEKRAHRFWVLTTYTTLANYQHSFAKIKFATIVFDEVQALKNPVSLRSVAARAMHADFRIGLTGTPIENSVADLWAIMDQLAPGVLGTLQSFRQRFGKPDEANMKDLYREVFEAPNGHVPLAIRRVKDQVAKDLPAKSRVLHPRLMPTLQAERYDAARANLLATGRGGSLKILHHIRTVSVHPSLEHFESNEDFVTVSGRLSATMDILKKIKHQRERALIFIEHRQMQHRFIALAKAAFGLQQIDLINGETPIHKRQAIVDRFQRHLDHDKGFDILVLGPKAAGTGLTLTAATHVIHLSRWWNPAVEEQCNDRVHRIGQVKPVSIHVPLAIHPGYLEHSFDCLLHSLMQRKRKIASSALWPMGDTDEDADALQTGLGADMRSDVLVAEAIETAVRATFARDSQPEPVFQADGSVSYQ